MVTLEPPSPFSGRWTWLAPVTGCFLALMVVSSGKNNQLGYYSDSRTTNWAAAAASNQSYAAYIMASFHSEQNALQNEPIEWTNGTSLPASPAVLSFATNNLIR